jgi:hypothetical protein
VPSNSKRIDGIGSASCARASSGARAHSRSAGKAIRTWTALGIIMMVVPASRDGSVIGRRTSPILNICTCHCKRISGSRHPDPLSDIITGCRRAREAILPSRLAQKRRKSRNPLAPATRKSMKVGLTTGVAGITPIDRLGPRLRDACTAADKFRRNYSPKMRPRRCR